VVIAELLAEKDGQEARHAVEITALRGRIAELERRVGLNSTNSSKPPSSDGLKKPPPKARRVSSLRKPSGKKTGGQPGHPGETLRRTETPNIITDHYPDACAKCSAPLTAAKATGYAARQVLDLPKLQPLVCTEHRAHDCRCTACGAKTHARFPEDVVAPVKYGKRIAAFVVYSRVFSVRAGTTPGRVAVGPVWSAPDDRDHRPDGPGLRRTLRGLRRTRAQSCGGRDTQAHG
jgi:transposase